MTLFINTLQPLLRTLQNCYKQFPQSLTVLSFAGDFNIHIDNAQTIMSKEIKTVLKTLDLAQQV